MRALKVLDDGAVGRFSGFRWPLPSERGPGAWVEDHGDTHACVRGVHACLPEHLPYWLGPELYVIELAGGASQVERKLVAPRGRLIRRVDRWNADARRAFAVGAALHARDELTAIARAEGEETLADDLSAPRDIESLRAALAVARPRGARTEASIHYVSDAILFSTTSVASSVYCAAHAGLSRERYLEARAFQARSLSALLDLDAALAG